MGWWLNAVYLAGLCGAAPYLVWQALHKGKYRNGWSEKLLGNLPRRSTNRPVLWAHGVSVGEVQALHPFVTRFQATFPHWTYLISTTTSTGYQVACQRFGPAHVCYCPLDFTWSVRTALRRVQPNLLVLAELEFWPNLITHAKRCGVPVAVINGRLSERSYHGYRRLRWLLSPVWRQLDAVAAQDDVYAQRFRDVGCSADAVRVTGSLKFDGVLRDRENDHTRQLARLWKLQPSELVWLAGSTQAPEERIVLDIMRRVAADFPQLRCIVAPRHPERAEEVAQLCAATGLSFMRRSQLPPQGVASRLLLIDTVGELRYWWGLSDVAFVGGSLGNRGGQNMLEPAAFGAAVSFGPNTWNFRDVVRLLLDQQAAVVVQGKHDLEQFVRRCLVDPGWRSTLGSRARRVVDMHQGATQATLEWLQCRIAALHAAAPRAA
jgi:3-deoxy-D-manno-octulosonic-acid transferase